jgi:hypothetical protein
VRILSKRFFAAAFATVLMLIWIAVAIWAARQTPPFDAAGLHFVGIVFVLPAFLLALFGRALNVAIVLGCIAAFMYLSVLVAGQISG